MRGNIEIFYLPASFSSFGFATSKYLFPGLHMKHYNVITSDNRNCNCYGQACDIFSISQITWQKTYSSRMSDNNTNCLVLNLGSSCTMSTWTMNLTPKHYKNKLVLPGITMLIGGNNFTELQKNLELKTLKITSRSK